MAKFINSLQISILLYTFLTVIDCKIQWLSCEELKPYVSQDGDYCLSIPEYGTNNKVLAKIYCHDMMSSSPQTFLTLPAGGEENYSKTYSYVWGTSLRSSGDVYFNKVKINLGSTTTEVTVTSKDYTFTDMVNRVQSGDLEFMSGWGISFGCGGCGTRQYDAKINLTGTPFTLFEETSYSMYGWNPCTAEPVVISNDLQFGTLICVGSCGGCYLQNPPALEQNLVTGSDDVMFVYLKVNSALVNPECQINVQFPTTENLDTDMLYDDDHDTCVGFTANVDIQHMFCLAFRDRALIKLSMRSTSKATISLTVNQPTCEQVHFYASDNFPDNCLIRPLVPDHNQMHLSSNVCELLHYDNVGLQGDKTKCKYECSVDQALVVGVKVDDFDGMFDICNLDVII